MVFHTFLDLEENQLSQKIDEAYDYDELFLKPFKIIKTQDHKLDQPTFSLKEVIKAKQIRETEFNALAEIQSDVRELMVQGEKYSQIKNKIKTIRSQIVSFSNYHYIFRDQSERLFKTQMIR